ncbi:caspase family protein [Streptomyces mobaraensis NBRC 13819 = DSM 40847]|uniref:caspase family protein n=1 Tax=Streptomyces mobaraensis TaxID=35621 RepID=UPI001319F52A|nr:caspase family protein [Streptomyces mobaraensis]QTT76450.1 caspase family protein [Streptomyces mobaraensis NBRC 13819 = DSM 40847]
MSDSPLRDYSRSRAVLIGVSDYRFLPPVPPAGNSLDRMAGLLTGPLCDWPAHRVHIERDPRRRGGLPDTLMTAYEDVTDVALFYFVGHGHSVEDELCLALCESPEEGYRRTTIGLPFADVRAALRACEAQTKILILDCCFAGVATQPRHCLGDGHATERLIDMTAGTGAITLAASGAYNKAGFEPDRVAPRPQTYFTKYFVDVVEQGVPGHPGGLPLNLVYARTADALARDRRPAPTCSSRHDAGRFILARNAAEPAGPFGMPQPEAPTTPPRQPVSSPPQEPGFRPPTHTAFVPPRPPRPPLSRALRGPVSRAVRLLLALLLIPLTWLLCLFPMQSETYGIRLLGFIGFLVLPVLGLWLSCSAVARRSGRLSKGVRIPATVGIVVHGTLALALLIGVMNDLT